MLKGREILVLLTICCIYGSSDGTRQLRILGLFPHPGKSHFHFFYPIMRGLADIGHDVTVVSNFPDKSPSIRYKDFPLNLNKSLTDSVDLKMLENPPFFQHFLEFFMLYEWGKEACNFTLRSDALAAVLKQQRKFDIVIMEMFNTDCMMGVAHVLNAPVIGLSSCAIMPWHYERLGAPMIPSYIPTLFLENSENMNFLQRMGNWISFHALNAMYKFYSIPAADKLVRRKFGQEFPSVGDLVKNTSMFFVNQHFSLSGAKPLPPNVIELGGIHIEKAKPLDVDIQKFLDNAEHGVILISWGSMIKANTMSSAKREGILSAIKRLKQRVIWKWEDDTLENKSDNLMVRSWVPQRDILCHPNVKVFMTHGGLMGSSEAAYCGVPVVATPMYGDQFLNSAALQNRGMGVILHYRDIKESTVMKAIKAALDKKTAENAKAVSISYKHRPLTSLQTAIWWVEYMAKTQGAPFARVKAPQLPTFIYDSIDIYLTLAVIAIIIVKCWSWAIRKCLSRSSQQQTVSTKKNN